MDPRRSRGRTASRRAAAPIGVVLLLWLAAPARAQLDGISEIGHSYQSDARGGCEVSIGDTALAHVRQPASVVLQSRGRFDSKITNIFPVNRWNDIDDSSFSTVDQFLSYNFGAVVPLNDRVGAGFAYEVGGFSSAFPGRTAFPGRARMDTQADLRKQSVYASLGMKVTDRLYVGAGPHVEIMHFKADLPVGPALLSMPLSESVGGGFQVGGLYRLTDRVRLGLSYASPTFMGAMRADRAEFLAPGGRRVGGPLTIEPFSLPGRASFGASLDATERLKVALEGAYMNYGSSFFGDVDLSGLVDGRFRPGYQDIWVINAGADYDFSERWSGSAGYVYNTGPIDRRTMVPLFASNAQSQFTTGLRYTRGHFWTGFAYIVSLPSLTRSLPGTHPELGPDYGASTVRQSYQSLNFGVGFNF